jgi:Spy/CpxP family protein refolding chaperone
MKRTWALVGAAALAVVGAAAVTQAQAPGAQGPQGRPGARMEQRGPQGQGPQGQGQPGVRRGRGPGRPGGQAGPGRPGGPGRRGGGPGFGLRGLGLTVEQREQVRAIHEQTREAIANVLTPEQKAKRRGR